MKILLFRIVLIIIILINPLLSFSQKSIPKKANTIKIIGIDFKTIANSLLDAGFTFERIDSNYQTIKTDFREGKGKTKWMKLRLLVRIKDSTALLTGDWYNTIFVGSNILGQQQTVENSIAKIENTFANPKNCFEEMNVFAVSLNKPVEYLIIK